MKLKELINAFKNKSNLLIILKSLGAIALITAVAAISVRYLTGDTLSDYAQANPEKAYADTSSDEPDETVSEVSESADIESSFSEEENNTGDPAIDIHISDLVHFYDTDTVLSDYIPSEGMELTAPGFYFSPLSSDVIDYITGCSFPSDKDTDPVISYDDLRYVGILYNDFNGLTQAGELICNEAIARDLTEIFSELYDSGYQLEKVVLIDNYGGDDTASMAADNTSCFNYRVVEGSESLSNHAYGLAVDINPFYNPYVVYGGNDDGSDYISPPGSDKYSDRSADFAYKIDETDLCYKLFTQHGFKWGGNWNSCKDYQHFEKK